MRTFTIVAAVLVSIGLAGCADMSRTQERTLTGTAIGTAAGVTVGLITGRPMTYVTLGAIAGSAGGYLYDQDQQRHERRRYRRARGRP